MAIEQTIEKLRKRKTDFNSKIWSDYQELRKNLHERVEAAIAELKTEQRKLNKNFIKAAINNADEPQLSDNLILDRVKYGAIEQKWIVMPEAHGIIPPPIKNFHAIAMLRNPDYFKDEPKYKKDLLYIAEVAMKKSAPQANKQLLEELEQQWDEVEHFKEELQGKNKLDLDPVEMTELHENYERMTRGYQKTHHSKPMTTQEAMAIQKSHEVGNTTRGMSPEEMADHIKLQSGSYHIHHGPNGREVVKNL